MISFLQGAAVRDEASTTHCRTRRKPAATRHSERVWNLLAEESLRHAKMYGEACFPQTRTQKDNPSDLQSVAYSKKAMYDVLHSPVGIEPRGWAVRIILKVCGNSTRSLIVERPESVSVAEAKCPRIS